jgi:hypothetical protein
MRRSKLKSKAERLEGGMGEAAQIAGGSAAVLLRT